MKAKLKKVKKPVKLLKAKKKVIDPKNKKKLETVSTDEFMRDFMKDVQETSRKSNEVNKVKIKKKQGKTVKNKKASKLQIDIPNDNDSDKNDAENQEESLVESEDESDAESIDDTYKSHKSQLHNLKKSDPEFYEYLEKHDQDLLNFEDSEDDSGEDEDKIHKPPNELEVASDESDYELDEEIAKQKIGSHNKVSKEMVDKWQNKLKSRCQIKDLRDVVEAFHAAVVSVTPGENVPTRYKVEGATAFNSVIRMCVVDFLPAVEKILKRKAGSKIHPEKCKNWNKVKPILKDYLTDLSELSTASSSNILTVLLKHIHQLCPFIVCFPTLSFKFLKRVTQLWATDEDVVRVLSFLCVLRLSNLRTSLLQKALKIMHLSYVRNTKFVSPNSLPGINFMRQSLCEMFALDNTISYHMVFLYIRQLAIHLRSAITLKKKESYKIVYNWAYISSLRLWADLFGITLSSSPLKSLIYPLVQIIIGTIKLISSPQYFPLRFHCCKILIHISSKCGIFIPVLPFLLEILRDFNFNKDHKKLSMKPMDLTCLLRCSKAQMKESGFKDAVIENIYSLLMEYLAVECCKVSFPDMMVPCIIQLKQFLKTCKVANYSKKIKSVLDKICENSKFIEEERKKMTLKLDDPSSIAAAESAINAKVPPFLKYYESWRKIHNQQQARKVTKNEELGDFKLPDMKKITHKRTKNNSKSEGPTILFPSDDENSDGEGCLGEVEEVVEPPKKRRKENMKGNVKNEYKSKNHKQKEEFESDEEKEDIIVDLKYSDLK